MVKVLVEYKPEIHEDIIGYMEEQVRKGNEKMQKGVNIPTREVNIAGKTVVIGEKIKETVNQSLVFSFNYEVLSEGKMEITFKSMGDTIPMIEKVFRKMCKIKIQNSLRKEFGKDKIIAIKEVK